jgi:hypothetical protein
VTATAPASSGGVDAGPTAADTGTADAVGSDAATDGEVGPVAACDRGVTVVLSDYTSTQIALSGLDGTTLSAAFLSSASTKTSGVSYALGGDVVVPTATPSSGRVVLIDRYGTNVLTWADPTTAKVLAQLPVGTGFESNPQDYLEIDDTRAYVTRWGDNPKPGSMPFDTGSDVLVIDTRAPKILSSIAMPEAAGLPPRPSGMLQVGDTTLVVLQRLSDDFKSEGETQLVGIRAGAVAWTYTLTHMIGCGRISRSPSGKTIALSCAGQLATDGTVVDPTATGIITLDVTSLPPKELRRYAIVDQLPDGAADQLAFASESLVIGKTQTILGGASDNRAFSLDLGSGKVTTLLTANKDASGKGKGIVYGTVRCAIGCGDVCLMADADVGKLQRWSIGAGGLTPMAAMTVETSVGLPPISLGGF